MALDTPRPLPGTLCLRWQEWEPLPGGCGKSLSTLAKLPPMQRQCLPWAFQTCHLLLFLGQVSRWGLGSRQLLCEGLRHSCLSWPCTRSYSSLSLQEPPVWAPDLPWGLFWAPCLVSPSCLHTSGSFQLGRHPFPLLLEHLVRTPGGSPGPAQGSWPLGWRGGLGGRAHSPASQPPVCQLCCQSAQGLPGPGVSVLPLGLVFLPGVGFCRPSPPCLQG